MGCSNSKSIETNEQKKPLESVLRKPSNKPNGDSNHSSVPKSVAFEVSLDEGSNDSSSKNNDDDKKPSLPKRLLERLHDDDHPSSPEVMAEQLSEKQRKAEERRLQVLDERLSKARASISSSGKIPSDRTESRFGDRREEEDDERSRSPDQSPTKKA